MKVCDEAGTRPHFIYMSPCGKTLTQERVKELAEMPNIAILCGRYEGVDQRVIDEIVDEEISIGDYVVTGGEMPAMILADAVSRMLPGVLSQPEGYMGESHYSSLLEYPQYTKPPVWHDMAVPEVLSSGHHANIKKWQRERAIERTLERRPELLENAELSKMKRPVISVIFENKGANFSVKARGSEFECKLISGAKKNVPIIFREDGVFLREHSVKFFDFTVLKYRTKHSYSFESDKKKIVVVCPKCEMQLLRGGRENLIFAGERVGEYTVYDEASFERAVQFGYLGEKK
jgi:tRNA (guanine37-N1)-methyltransferase